MTRRTRRRHLHRNRQGRHQGRRQVIIGEQRNSERDPCRCRVFERTTTMAEPVIKLEHVSRTYHVGDVDVHALARRQPDHRGRRVRRHHGLIRLRQVDADGDPRLSRPAERRRLSLRRRRRGQLGEPELAPLAQRTPRLRLPELQPSAAHQRAGKRGAAAVLRGDRPGQGGFARERARAALGATGLERSRAQHARASSPAGNSSASPLRAR